MRCLGSELQRCSGACSVYCRQSEWCEPCDDVGYDGEGQEADLWYGYKARGRDEPAYA